jgi:2'-5' RNA ligase
MRLVLAVQLPKTVLPPIAALREKLSALAAGDWLPPEQLALRLLDLGEVDELQLPSAQHALDKAAAAHQGFEVQLRGLLFSESWRRARDAYVPVVENAGMLQAVTFSTLRRLPAALAVQPEEPWRPKLLLARFERAPSAQAQLSMKASLGDQTFAFSVREIALLSQDSGALAAVHTAKLPG